MNVSTLIVGQGLAGSLLAWELIKRGQHVLVVDDENVNTASKVAAGIMNPITGQRLVRSWQVDVLLPAALACYRALAQALGQRFYQQHAMLRLLQSDAQLVRWRQRRDDPLYQPYLGNYFPEHALSGSLAAPFGGFEQRQTGYLMIPRLLEALKQFFIARRSYLSASVDHNALNCEGGAIKWGNVTAQRVVFCEGYQARRNPWFSNLPFQPSKGEILRFESDTKIPRYIISDNHWLLPLKNNVYRAGATYTWDALDNEPTEEGRNKLLVAVQRKLKQTLSLHNIVQQAAVRPTTKDKRPFIGSHPDNPRILIFNGFGSKGSLMIPYYAARLGEYLLQGVSLPPEVDSRRFENLS